MENKTSLIRIMRMLHRNVGYYLIGFVIIYSLSGVLLIYRDTDLLKQETVVEKNLPKDTDPAKLGEILRIRKFNIIKEENNIFYFENGSFDRSTGQVLFTTKEPLPVLQKINSFHKLSSKDGLHWVSLGIGILLFFMAISSFWMYKKGSKTLKRGILIAVAGLITALAVVFI
ncbi:MAG: hypothetical protein HC905_26795 [Bacteroidales bacterium]|nr:hypothetical protein [Bacteroidales bacterium]